MAGEDQRITLSHVAAAAGVSKATVSKALNGRDDVSAATRRRVLETVAALGYESGRPAAHTSRSAVAVVFDVPASPYVLGVLHGTLAAAEEAGIGLLTRMAPPLASRTDAGVARAWAARQRAAGVVGVVGITLAHPDALVDAVCDAGLPFVMVDAVDTAHPRLVNVSAANVEGARAATTHLLELGHRRIAWAGGPQTSGAARARFAGFRATLDDAGIVLDPSLVRSGRFEVATGEEAGRELLSLPQPPTAIVAASDEIAVGVLAAARALDVRVPDDVSVIGFDDTPQAQWTNPPLTTVHQPLDTIGRTAVTTVTSMAAGQRPSSRKIELGTSLTVRATTAPAAGAGQGPLTLVASA